MGWLVLALAFVAGDVRTHPLRLPAPAEAPARRIDGIVRVHDAQGHPVEGAVVTLLMMRGQERARADAAGDARVHFPLAEVAITVIAHGYALHRTAADATTLGPAPVVDVTLLPAVRVEGRIVDANGQPIAGARVSAILDADPNAPPFPGVVAADGSFTLDHLPGARVVVTASADGYEDGSRLLDLGRGPVEGLVFALDRTGSLVATIVDAEHRPVPSATLVIGGSGVYPPRTFTANSSGVVEWVGIPQGIYELRASKDARVSQRSSGVRVEPGDDVAVELVLGPSVSLRGTVLGTDDRPLDGAEIVLSEDVLDLIPRTADTARDGTFVIDALLGTPHYLVARADGYIPFGPTIVTPGPDAITIHLVQAASIRGRVVDATGHPVEGALVTIVDERGRPRRETSGPALPLTAGASSAPAVSAPLQGAGELGVTIGAVPPIPLGTIASSPTSAAMAPGSSVANLGTAAAVTGRDGTFDLLGVPPGVVQLSVEHGLYPSVITGPRRIAGGHRIDDWEIVLPEGGHVDGRVVDARDMPVANVIVELRSDRESVPRNTVTARDGTFTFDGVAGAIVLTALPSGQPAGRVRLDVAPGATVEAVIPLEDAFFELSGRILDGGGYPVENAQVSIVSLRARTPFEATVFTERDGSFSFGAMPRPPYRLEVDHPDYAKARLAEVVPRDRGVEVRLQPGGDVEGHLVDAWSHEPVAAALVSLYQGDELVQEDAAGRDGRFHFERLPPGRYRLVATSPEHLPIERDAVLEETRWDRPHADVGEIAMAGAATIVGMVTDAVGEPVPEARVYLPYTAHAPETRTDARGRYELRNVPPGTHELFAEHRLAGTGQARRSLRVDAHERVEDVDVRLSGRMTDDEGTPGAGIVRGVAAFVEDRDGVVVTWVGPGSAAEHGGVRVGDHLRSVDGEDVTTALQARALLRGPDGVRAVLVLERGTRTLRLLVDREAHRPPPPR